MLLTGSSGQNQCHMKGELQDFWPSDIVLACSEDILICKEVYVVLDATLILCVDSQGSAETLRVKRGTISKLLGLCELRGHTS